MRRASPARLFAVAVAAALVLAPAARGGDDRPARPFPRQPRPAALPPGADRVELLVHFPPWQYSGTFRISSASGALADDGTARDAGGLASDDAPVERVLEGAKGTLVLRLAAGPKASGFPPIFGRWTIVRGTGAYAELAGAGTFTACSAGDAMKGSPFEVQTLLGHVHRPGGP